MNFAGMFGDEGADGGGPLGEPRARIEQLRRCEE
jgi:hypothetical protein